MAICNFAKSYKNSIVFQTFAMLSIGLDYCILSSAVFELLPLLITSYFIEPDYLGKALIVITRAYSTKSPQVPLGQDPVVVDCVDVVAVHFIMRSLCSAVCT